jgi:hypothetical protein
MTEILPADLDLEFGCDPNLGSCFTADPVLSVDSGIDDVDDEAEEEREEEAELMTE